jgi:rRNA methylases
MNTKQELEKLSDSLTENKRARIAQVLAHRTKHVTVVLENIEQSQNANAVIRTCDVFGIQDIHCIESNYRIKAQNTVSKGATNWVDMHHYPTTSQCIDQLKSQGYAIVATTPHAQGHTIAKLPLDQKIALFFGTEISGLSEEVINKADYFVTIPMVGFTESLNISVSVGICLYQITQSLHQSSIPWHLTEEQRDTLNLYWAKRILHIIR